MRKYGRKTGESKFEGFSSVLLCGCIQAIPTQDNLLARPRSGVRAHDG